MFPGPVAATDFGAFLKRRGPAADAAVAPPASAEERHPLTPDSVVVTVLFGTEFGFSKEIAEKLADALRDAPPYWWTLFLGIADLMCH